mmetsp:Transcript_22966/g.28182  ORF Transcript_22966/g.28182 Transcript_22966/m.28182 type:complete len:147 (+) Transcript_22966:118-558(+)
MAEEAVESYDGDAPGWTNREEEESTTETKLGKVYGPICWKCLGKKSVTKKLKKRRKCKSALNLNLTSETVVGENAKTDFPCTVCHGNGRTKRKQKNTQRHQLQRKKKIVRVYPPGYIGTYIYPCYLRIGMNKFYDNINETALHKAK